MITDDRTYVVFLSTWLKKSYPKFFDKFTACLNENDIKWRFIGNTADIWCRDYMPIQIETDEFVQYRYYPDYLTKRESDKKYITNPDKACKSMYLFPSKKTDLVIDGGNVVKGADFVIMTEKVYHVITAKRKACGIKNEMRFSDGKTKCAIKKHPSNETWMLFC